MMSKWSLVSSAVFSSVLSILLLTGIIGNVLVVIVTTRRKTRLLPGGVFIRSLAISDAGGAANIIFMLTTIILRGQWVFGHVGCQISGTLVVFFGSASLHLLCIISINRYLKIAKTGIYRRVFNRTGTRMLLIIPWTLPLMMSIAPVFGWSAHTYQFSKCICHFHFSTSLSYTITFIFAVVAIPLSISALCYVRMYYIIRNHTSSMKNLQRKSPAANIEEIRSARTIFVLIVAFLLCYTPGSIINILEMADYHVPPLLDLISITLIVSKHAQNPLLYGMLNRRYRKELFKIARSVVRSCKCSSVDNQEESNSRSRSRRKSHATGNSNNRQRSFSIDSPHGCARIIRRDHHSPRSSVVTNPRQSCEPHPQLVVVFKANRW